VSHELATVKNNQQPVERQKKQQKKLASHFPLAFAVVVVAAAEK